MRRQLIVATVVIYASTKPALASFTPVAPATCPAITEVNWSYSLNAVGGWMIPADPNNGNNYIDNVFSMTGLSGNEYITQFGVRVNSFQTEPNYDYLNIFGNSSGVYLTGGADWGNPISGWYDFSTLPSLPSNYLYINFNSDYSVNDTGIYLDRARVCTNIPGKTLTNPEHQIGAPWRTTGVLLGTNDVAYFTASVGSIKSGDTCSSAHDTFALWGDPSAGNDFDLYVRCGAQPTPTQYDYRGYSGDTQEFIHATTATCPCGSQWHIAVQSYSGSGWFNLVNQKHYASEHGSNADIYAVSQSLPIAPATMQAYQAQVSAGFKYFFGANEGARYWDSISLRQSFFAVGQQMNILSDATGRPHSDVCEHGSFWCNFGALCELYLYKDWYDGPTLAHEMGHHINCLQDEYEDSQGTECGHSIMGSQFRTNTNYCYCNNQPSGQNKCAVGSGDHGWDTSPANLTALQTGTSWINLGSRSPFPIYWTPDNYDYTAFDFNGLYGNALLVP